MPDSNDFLDDLIDADLLEECPSVPHVARETFLWSAPREDVSRFFRGGWSQAEELVL